jgi:hypothetical protein
MWLSQCWGQLCARARHELHAIGISQMFATLAAGRSNG